MPQTTFLLKKIFKFLRKRMKVKFNRHVPIGDLFTSRWETAGFLGFGKGASCYNSALVLGDVSVGQNTWIGPNVILDGSGGPLSIGDFCSISAGVQIYTHDTVAWSTSLGEKSIDKKATSIGHGVYIGPNCIIQKGVTIGDGAVIGAMSFVNNDVKENAKVLGCPAKIK